MSYNDKLQKHMQWYAGHGLPVFPCRPKSTKNHHNTAGTVIQMAQSRGWQPVRNGGRELGWDDMIGIDDCEGCVVEWKASE